MRGPRYRRHRNVSSESERWEVERAAEHGKKYCYRATMVFNAAHRLKSFIIAEARSWWRGEPHKSSMPVARRVAGALRASGIVNVGVSGLSRGNGGNMGREASTQVTQAPMPCRVTAT